MTADHAGQTGGEREVCGHVPQPQPMHATRHVSCVESGEHEWHRDGGVHWSYHVIWYDGDDAVPALSRPVPVPGQAAREFPGSFTAPSTGAREAAVEAVARDEVIALLHHHITPAIGWWRMADHDGKPFDHRLLDERFERAADAVIAALSAAPGQVMCDADDGKPATVAGVLLDGEHDVTANYCDDCADLCERHTDFRPNGRPGQEQP